MSLLSPYILFSESSGTTSPSRTWKVNFGNNSTQTVAGYTIMNGTNDDNGDAITVNELNSLGNIQLINLGDWSGLINSDTTNATTGDLAVAILEGSHQAGANNANTIGKRLSGLTTTKYYRIYITSVARNEDVTNYDCFWKIIDNAGDPGTGGEITVDPVAQKGSPELILIGDNKIPDVDGVLDIYTREPGAFISFLNSLIIEEYDELQ